MSEDNAKSHVKALLVGCNHKDHQTEQYSTRRHKKKKRKKIWSTLSSLHSPLLLSRWQVSPELTVGPLCVWFGEIVPAPHYGVSHRLSTIRCPVKSTPLQPNNLQRLLLSLALQLPSCLCELYAAFCSPSCALLREASTTTTAAMTKGSICGRIGAILHRGLHGFQPLTA